ncbi:amino acid permease [Parashewanella spongiae]|uniref:Amino acid permease n=1 Tax=Parashewanella spongiae TaxID=342950 RepID=A0A3A6UG35_9GAMM|nr:aromatic amino acid transport family protein [Parashewanella spongiae]MCL1078999.1 amino acid permease [Parashewanella spongiae]RJY17823.1 amino acid permease [Parashewanella spongiae]
MNSKMLGSIAIVSGTAIGGGMLALPLATAGLGTLPALAMLVVIWVISAYTALLMLEINLKSGVGENVHVITGKSLGKVGQFLQGGSFLSLLYALTMVYLLGGSSLLNAKYELITGHELDSKTAIGLFTLIFGGLIAVGVSWVDRASRLLFPIMIVLLIVLVMFLLPEVSLSSIVGEGIRSGLAEGGFSGVFMAAIPVVFTSFGFHVCIATLVGYLDGDAKSLRKVLLIGSTLPLICYVFWLLVTLGTVGGDTISAFGGSLPALVKALQDIAQLSFIDQCISFFADLALVTSFLGVTMSLFDFLAELTRARNTLTGRAKTWLLTFIPPLLCALFYPDGFVKILGYAAVPLVMMVIFLPIAMAIVQRKQSKEGYQVSGGTPALALLGLAGFGIIVAQFIVASAS